MNISEEAKALKENRLLRNNKEIENFECALENILNNEDFTDIKYLCLGFDDRTENEEVMFGLIHAIESYDSIVDMKLTLKEFVDSIQAVYSDAKGWIKIMNKRILNNEKSLKEYVEIVENCDEDLKQLLKELMNGARG